MTSWEGLRPPSPLTEKRDGEDSQGTIEPPKEAAVLKKVQKKGGGSSKPYLCGNALA
ncbi:MAG: hypothetical protein OXC92_02745 [Flavobacteriaceae bacterium]|nr:hypothetical protein [Flavobacteriaceae bacterium]MCY4253934.1 hypothetical protein [Flavobacteriaceae bacterium]